jgi:hypothetical protein
MRTNTACTSTLSELNGSSLQFSSTERPHQKTSRVERSFSIALVNKVSLQWSSPSLNYHTA